MSGLIRFGSFLSACTGPMDCTGNEAIGYTRAILKEDSLKPMVQNPHIPIFVFPSMGI